MRIKILDDFLLNLFQRFSDWSYEYFGVSNFCWARITSCTAMFIIPVMGIGQVSWFMSVFLPLLMLFARLEFIKRVEEETLHNSEEKGCVNNEAMHWNIRLWQVFSLFWAIPLFPRFPLLVIFLLFIILSLYFIACTPKPPTKSKLRKLLETLRKTWLIAPEPTPA